jgi:uncharacterized protein (DUF924 family)
MAATTTDTATINNERYNAVLDYWFGPDRENPKVDVSLWYDGDVATDEHIRKEFGKDLLLAEEGKYNQWLFSGDKYSALALIVLLDQFGLNAYRDQAKGFQVSASAIPLTYEAIKRGYHKELPKPMAGFLFMPLMHSEVLADQDNCVRLFAETVEDSSFAHHHRDIVKQYGRFPGRNKVLGRTSTEAELKYLADGGVF